MLSPFPPRITRELPGRLLRRLNSARDWLSEDLPRVRSGEKAPGPGMSVLNRVFEGIWSLWVYPGWEPVRAQWTGPDSSEVARLASDLLVIWEEVCERDLGPSEHWPYYTWSAAVRAATLRRAGLGQPVSCLTTIERRAVQETLKRNTPDSDLLGPALWHARDLGLDFEAAEAAVAAVRMPETTDTDFKPWFTRVLHVNLGRAADQLDVAHLRREVANCAMQHYAWVANTPVENVSLSFVAAFTAALSQARPDLLRDAPTETPVSFALSADGVRWLHD